MSSVDEPLRISRVWMDWHLEWGGGGGGGGGKGKSVVILLVASSCYDIQVKLQSYGRFCSKCEFAFFFYRVKQYFNL